MKRRGLSLIEVMIAVVVLGLALVPVMTMGAATHRKTYFNESQQLAVARARALLDLVGSLPADWFFELSSKRAAGQFGQTIEVDPEKLFGQAQIVDLFGPMPGTAGDKSLERAGQLKHAVTWTLRAKDRGELVATVSWLLPGERSGHQVRLARVLTLKEAAYAIPAR